MLIDTFVAEHANAVVCTGSVKAATLEARLRTSSFLLIDFWRPSNRMQLLTSLSVML